MLEKGHGKRFESEDKKHYFDIYKRVPTKENAYSVLLKGDDFQAANHMFEWNMISKIIEPVFSVNGSYAGQNVYFYRSPYEKNLESNEEA